MRITLLSGVLICLGKPALFRHDYKKHCRHLRLEGLGLSVSHSKNSCAMVYKPRRRLPTSETLIFLNGEEDRRVWTYFGLLPDDRVS